MKKVILAVAIASVCGAANAATIYKNDNGDYAKVYGGMEIGGTYALDKENHIHKNKGNAYIDDSFLTIGIKGQTGDFYAKFELDAERQNWTLDNQMRLVIDKAYVGYELPSKMGSLEVGRTDTAYDHVDAKGDFSNELAFGVSEAGDQDNTIKYQNQFDSWKVAVSHSLEGFDGVMKDDGTPDAYSYITDSRYGAVTNGYVGYFGKSLTAFAGFETVEDSGKILSAHGIYKLDKLAFGAIMSKADFDNDSKDSLTTVLSASYKLTDKVKGYAVFSRKTLENNSAKDDQNIVVGAEYKPERNVKLVAEGAFGAEKASDVIYAKAYYWF